METFVFAGSTGGATRTDSSILLAAGALGLGFEPFLIQVFIEGNSSVSAHVRGLPFVTSVIEAGRGERITDRIRARSRGKAKYSPVIVDMPAQDVLETLLMLSGLQVQILVPMPEWLPDPGEAVADFKRLKNHWQHWEKLKRQCGARPVPLSRQPSVRLFPVGVVPDDVVPNLRRRNLLSDDESQASVVYPGLPRFNPSEMNFANGSHCFALTESQIDASARIARALLVDID
ncbi:hypothetical protein [Microvirga sp. M2]|uniref:hypothetical protein n=1 Tax=Microvirga sp. M2 TaxID=3073270 RepID=UPI0039C1E54E